MQQTEAEVEAQILMKADEATATATVARLSAEAQAAAHTALTRLDSLREWAPSRKVSIAITKIEEAILWLEGGYGG